MTVLFIANLALLDSHAATPAPLPNPAFIVLIDQLDEAIENDFYCADVAGSEVAADAILQAHTCKEPTHDELWETNSLLTGNIYVSDHNLCVTASGPPMLPPVAGAKISVQLCDPINTHQFWMSSPEGEIRPVDDLTLCWTVSRELIGDPAGASSDHLQREMTLESCKEYDGKYNRWILPGGFVGKGP
jgi:hypothetical protein